MSSIFQFINNKANRSKVLWRFWIRKGVLIRITINGE
jgi:hypothetical protein